MDSLKEETWNLEEIQLFINIEDSGDSKCHEGLSMKQVITGDKVAEDRTKLLLAGIRKENKEKEKRKY